MKKLLIPALILLTGNVETGFSQNWTAAGNLTRKVMLTLQPDEHILATESCLPLEVNGDALFLVTRSGEQFYVYDNGQRKGPYEKLDQVTLKPCEIDRYGVTCSVFSTPETTPDPSMVSMTEEGQFLINFKGKAFGPVQFLQLFHVWPDQSGFIALGMDAAMKFYLLNSEGAFTVLEGSVDKIQFSPSGKNYVFVVKEDQALNSLLQGRDLSSLTTEEIMEIAREQEEENRITTLHNAWIYSGNKGKLGPFDAGVFASDNPAFTTTGGDNWFMIIDNTLYINGDPVKKFEDFHLYSCRVWLSKDGKRYAVVSNDRILFSDGSSFAFPVKIDSFEKDGKVFIKWITLENEKDLVAYTREL